MQGLNQHCIATSSETLGSLLSLRRVSMRLKDRPPVVLELPYRVLNICFGGVRSRLPRRFCMLLQQQTFPLEPVLSCAQLHS